MRLGSEAQDLVRQVAMSAWPVETTSLQLRATRRAEEVWAAVYLASSIFSSVLIVSDSELNPLWRFACHRMGLANTIIEEWSDDVPDYPGIITDKPVSPHWPTIYLSTCTAPTWAHVVCAADPKNITYEYHDLESMPSWGAEVEQEVVSRSRSLVHKNDFEDFYRRLQKAREMPKKWELCFRSRNAEPQQILTEQGKECAICLEVIPIKKASMMKSCGHIFCTDCLSRWVTESEGGCPFCREVGEVIHSMPKTMLCEMEPNPFYPWVQNAIRRLVKMTMGPVAVASAYKYHVRDIVGNWPELFVLYPPGVIMEGVWVAIAKRHNIRAHVHIIVTDSVGSDLRIDMLIDAIMHKVRSRLCSVHTISGFPLNKKRVRDFLNYQAT